MIKIVIAMLVLAPAVVGQTVEQGTGPRDVVRYHFENDRFLISRLDVELSPDGTGRVVFTRKGLAAPVERPLRVSAAVARTMFERLDAIDFVHASEVYQSKREHPNLGSVTLSATRTGASREVRFNYTENRSVDAVAKMLRGIANREMFAFDLETASQFQPLDTPKLLDTLGDEIRVGNVADTGELLPLLRRIADDLAMPLIARNRARDLADKIEAGRSH